MDEDRIKHQSIFSVYFALVTQMQAMQAQHEKSQHTSRFCTCDTTAVHIKANAFNLGLARITDQERLPRDVALLLCPVNNPSRCCVCLRKQLDCLAEVYFISSIYQFALGRQLYNYQGDNLLHFRLFAYCHEEIFSKPFTLSNYDILWYLWCYPDSTI